MKWLLGVIAALVLAVVIGGAWLFGTEGGLRFALAQLQLVAGGRLIVEDAHGALAREVRAQRIRYTDASTTVELREPALQLDLLALLRARADIRSLRAEALDIATSGAPSAGTGPVALPLSVRMRRADIAHIRVAATRIDNFRLRDGFLGRRGRVRAAASFDVPDERFPAQVDLSLAGTLDRLETVVSGSVAGIDVSAKAVIAPKAAAWLQSVEAKAGPLDAQRLESKWPHTAITLALNGQASAGDRLAGTLTARNVDAGPLDRERLPIATLHSRFATDFSAVTLSELDIGLGAGGRITGRGQAQARSATLEVTAKELDLRAIVSSLRSTRLAGPLALTATPEAQSLRGTLTEGDVSVAADVTRRGEVLEVRSLHAAASGGIATGEGRMRLDGAMAFDARLALTRFDPASFGDFPEGSINARVEGSGNAREQRGEARWTVEDSRLRGDALTSRGSARFARERVTEVHAQARLGAASLTADGGFGRPGDALAWQLELPRLDQFVARVHGRLRATGEISGAWREPRATVRARASEVRLPNGLALDSLEAQASGTLSKHEARFALRAEDIDLDGRVRGRWQGAGWSGEMLELRNSGRFPLRLAAPATLEVARSRIQLERLDAALGDGRLRIEELRWSPASLASKGEFRKLPAQWLILASGLADRLAATMRLDGRWALEAAPRLSGSASIARAEGDVSLTRGAPIALGMEKLALEARFDDGRVTLQATLDSRYGTLQGQGHVDPVAGAEGLGITRESPIEATAQVRLAELRTIAQPLLADAHLDGRVSAALRIAGRLGDPQWRGELRGEAIAFDMAPYGIYLKNGEFAAALEGDILRVARFSIQAGDGRLTAQGAIPLKDAAAGARLEWRAENFSLLERPNLRVVASGHGVAGMEARRLSLSGELRAERGFVELEQDRLPRLGDDVVVVGQPREERKASARIPLALDLQVDLGNNLQVLGYGLEGKLAGQLKVQTTNDGELRLYGRIHTVNATFVAYGQRLQVDPGEAIFDGPVDNPALQMTAWRRNQQVEVGVQVTGNARSPHVQLVSQPPVPEVERLSWLVLGRGPGDVTKADLGLLQAAAGALLSRGDQVPLDRRVARAFGLDEISLRGSSEVAERVVAVGKRLSDRLYVSYEQGIGAVASSLVKLDLSLTRRLSVRAETGTSSGVGLYYRFSWD